MYVQYLGVAWYWSLFTLALFLSELNVSIVYVYKCILDFSIAKSYRLDWLKPSHDITEQIEETNDKWITYYSLACYFGFGETSKTAKINDISNEWI